MEDSYGPARSLPGLDGRAPYLDSGRMGGVFCRLHRERFDGIVRVQSASQVTSIGFRAGNPVMLDDAAQGHTLGEQFVERGQLTRAQCNAVIARVTESLVDDEAVAFCDHAVELGYISEEEAKLELSERIRTRMIQVLSWKDCEVELEPGEAALFERRELPQELGAIVYMGVRTFYEDDFIAQCLPDIERQYLRLTAAPASISHFFGLDDDEFQLLRKVDQDTPIASLLKQRGVDRTHVLSLIFLLALSQLGELSSTPFTQQAEPERSGARPAPRRPFSQPLVEAPASSASSASSDAFPAVSVPPSEGHAPLDAAMGRRISRPVDATQEALLEAAARTAKTRKSSSAVRRAPVEPPQPPAAPAPRSVPATMPQRAATQPSVPVPTRATSTAAPPHRSTATTGPLHAATPEPRNAAAPAQQVRTDYAKAHLDELIKRRKQAAAPETSAANSSKRDPARELKHARDLLRDQHYTRAEEVLRGLLDNDPDNEVLRTYHVWSRFRAQPDASETLVDELRELAKKLTQDTEHVAFAAYALGHVYFSAKRDDLAEKYFKRAHAADRTNKDAERHLLILERRKQQTAEQAAAANRKIFGIQISNAKPKP